MISALARMPAGVTKEGGILPNHEAKSLSVKARDVSILDKASENQLDRPSMVFIDNGLIEHSRQSIYTGLLL
jgi:hypothetical protein